MSRSKLAETAFYRLATPDCPALIEPSEDLRPDEVREIHDQANAMTRDEIDAMLADELANE